MLSINIALDTKMMDNFLVLGKTLHLFILGKEIKVNIINLGDITVEIKNDRIYKNYDLVVTSNLSYIDGRVKEYIYPHEKISLDRFTKPAQTFMIKDFHDKQKTKPKKFYSPVVRYSSFYEHHSQFAMEMDFEKPTDIIMKPLLGARGVGQIFFSKERTFSLVTFMKNFNGCLSSKMVYDLIQHYKQEYGDDAIKFELYNKPRDGENDGVVEVDTNDEGLNLLLNGFFFQEYVPVETEFRLLTDYNGSIAYVQKRNRIQKHFMQATGSDNGNEYVSSQPNDYRHFKSCLGTDISFLEGLCREVIGPLKSLDVFITEDKKWGLFEYSNQFGIEGVPKKFAYNLHKEFIRHIIHESGVYDDIVLNH